VTLSQAINLYLIADEIRPFTLTENWPIRVNSEIAIYRQLTATAMVNFRQFLRAEVALASLLLDGSFVAFDGK